MTYAGLGNLLGAEQSGFIADLGYETYQKILKEAVTELRTEEFADVMADTPEDQQDFVADCAIESDMELLLPASYVPQESERISLYQELDSIERESDLDALKSVCATVSARFRLWRASCCASPDCAAWHVASVWRRWF